MRALILGGSGMLGHKLWSVLSRTCDTHATFRMIPAMVHRIDSLDLLNAHAGVAVEDFDSVKKVIKNLSPNVVVNCIGLVKQSVAAKDPIQAITVNGLFPHKVATLCREIGSRLIQISTDCVFSGRRGNYSEMDLPDPPDLYGRSKLLGELTDPTFLSVRTSIIGRELSGTTGLIEWFLSQKDKTVRGFKRAIFSGLTTTALSNILDRIISERKILSGVWHIASNPISKFELLQRIACAGNLQIEIEPDEEFICDRSLNGRAFAAETGINTPDWDEMITGLASEIQQYEHYRKGA
jgi:dTDP-4-dehydrorhamnose reductase